jgi:hypothetical protein
MTKADEKIMREYLKRLKTAQELFPPRSPIWFENGVAPTEVATLEFGSDEADARSHRRLQRMFGELPPDDGIDPDSWGPAW